MKKIIRLTESDLTRIVRRVISEQNKPVDKTIFRSRFRVLLNVIKPLVISIFDKTYIKELDGNDKIKTKSIALIDNTIKKLIDPSINITSSKIDEYDFYYRLFKNHKRTDAIDNLRTRGGGPKDVFFVHEEMFKSLNSLFNVILKGEHLLGDKDLSGFEDTLKMSIDKFKNVKYIDYKPVVKNYRETPNSKDTDIIRNK